MADAELYEAASDGQRRAVARVLDEVWPRLTWPGPAGDVLDVGCGSGGATLGELLPRLPATKHLVAVDVSRDMLRRAEARDTERRVSFDQLDIAAPHLEGSLVTALGPYSKAFSFFCLHWVQDQRTALRNIARLLVPGGEAVLVLVAGCPLFQLYHQFSELPQWAPYLQDYKKFVSPYHHQEDPEQLLRTLLTQSGFEVKSCRLDKDFSFSSFDQLEIIDSLKAVVPFAARMPPEERDGFFRELLRASYANGTLSVDRQEVAFGGMADLHRWNFSLLVAHAARRHDPLHSRSFSDNAACNDESISSYYGSHGC